MMILLFLFLLVIGCSSCSSGPSAPDVEYLKVFSMGETDSVNTYNRGLGINSYLYYNPGTDSAIYWKRYISGQDPFRTHVGSLNEKAYSDTVQLLVLALRTYRSSFAYDTTSDGNPYCGPVLYAEFKDKDGLHVYQMCIDRNDTINDFINFFYRLDQIPWRKQYREGRKGGIDHEIVTAAQRLGFYEARGKPFFPSPCDSSIDLTKIYGSWRVVAGYHNYNDKRFTQLTFRAGRSWEWRNFREGEYHVLSAGTFDFKQPERLVMNTKRSTLTFKVVRLTESCLELLDVVRGEEYRLRFDRIAPISQ